MSTATPGLIPSSSQVNPRHLVRRRGPITPVIVTRRQARQQGKILTGFVVQAVSRTHLTASGATPWRILRRYDPGTMSVTVTRACSGRPPVWTSAAPRSTPTCTPI